MLHVLFTSSFIIIFILRTVSTGTVIYCTGGPSVRFASEFGAKLQDHTTLTVPTTKTHHDRTHLQMKKHQTFVKDTSYSSTD